MENYKHTSPKTFYDVTWMNVKDWWVNELGNQWEFAHTSEQYIVLKQYNLTHFPNHNKPAKPVRYLNRKEVTC